LSPLGATVPRVVLGAVYIAHGYYVYDIVTSDALSAMIAKRLGLPLGDSITSYILLANFVGGIMLILGVFTRIAALWWATSTRCSSWRRPSPSASWPRARSS
jgi:uncharacterized membrane protein YphA (DoxX/SURF4 family)